MRNFLRTSIQYASGSRSYSSASTCLGTVRPAAASPELTPRNWRRSSIRHVTVSPKRTQELGKPSWFNRRGAAALAERPHRMHGRQRFAALPEGPEYALRRRARAERRELGRMREPIENRRGAVVGESEDEHAAKSFRGRD